MTITYDQWLDHTNLNNSEFANRQVALRGEGPPGSLPGVMGWFYLDELTTPHTRYEKVGPLDTDWELFTAGSGDTGGGGDPSPVPTTSFYLTNSLTNVSSGVRHILPMVAPATPRYDTNGDWNYVNNCFEAPATGLYTITAHVEFEDAAVVYEKSIFLRSTGTYGHLVPGSSFSSEGENVLIVTGIFRMDQGDRVYLEMEHFAPVSVDLFSLSIHGVSNPPLPPHDHDSRYYTQAEVDAIIAGVVGGSKILGVIPNESPDGIRDTFTIPNLDEFLEGSMEIWVNGLYEGQPTRISPTQFQVSNPPLEVGDIIRCSYIKSN